MRIGFSAAVIKGMKGNPDWANTDTAGQIRSAFAHHQDEVNAIEEEGRADIIVTGGYPDKRTVEVYLAVHRDAKTRKKYPLVSENRIPTGGDSTTFREDGPDNIAEKIITSAKQKFGLN